VFSARGFFFLGPKGPKPRAILGYNFGNFLGSPFPGGRGRDRPFAKTPRPLGARLFSDNGHPRGPNPPHPAPPGFFFLILPWQPPKPPGRPPFWKFKPSFNRPMVEPLFPPKIGGPKKKNKNQKKKRPVCCLDFFFAQGGSPQCSSEFRGGWEKKRGGRGGGGFLEGEFCPRPKRGKEIGCFREMGSSLIFPIFHFGFWVFTNPGLKKVFFGGSGLGGGRGRDPTPRGASSQWEGGGEQKKKKKRFFC